MEVKGGFYRNAAIGLIVLVAVIFFGTKWKGASYQGTSDATYRDTYAELRACASERTHTVYPADMDSVIVGGIHIVSADSITKLMHGERTPEGMVDRGTRTIYFQGEHAAGLRLNVLHEMAHLLAVWDNANAGGKLVADSPRNEHASDFFVECVRWGLDDKKITGEPHNETNNYGARDWRGQRATGNKARVIGQRAGGYSFYYVNL